MAVVGEVVLRPRFCLGSECRALFFLCSRCDRGQRYCSRSCRDQARRRQQRGANRRHQQSPEGRLDHRDRQRQYRHRRAQARVTDQGSLSIAGPALSECGPVGSNSDRSSRPIRRRFTPSRAGDASGRLDVLPGLWPAEGDSIHGSVSTHSTTKVSPIHDQS